MKKLNLFIAVTLVAVSSIFTSCKKGDTVTNFPIINTFTASATTVAAVNDTVTISIKVSPGDKNINYITILSSATGAPAYDVKLGKSWTGDKTAAGYWNKDGIYTATATFIVPAGGATYTCTAYDTEGNASAASASQTVTITSNVTPPVVTFKSQSTELTNQTIHCFVDDGSSSSCYSISQKSANNTTYYNSGNGNGSANQVDFIYFNSKGTSYGLYSPYYFNANSKALGAIGTTGTGATDIGQWSPTPLNKTVFKIASLDYDNASNDDVVAAANSATATYIEGLPNIPTGSVVVFKTASTSTTASKVGIFKVNSITPNGTNSSATVVISLRVQN
ncbi:MAG: hypothetical protein P4L28_04600 [Paludibacteraceae bacterium]|nr:hypothetical protein [Paludibacteraceae bacterium]